MMEFRKEICILHNLALKSKRKILTIAKPPGGSGAMGTKPIPGTNTKGDIAGDGTCAGGIRTFSLGYAAAAARPRGVAGGHAGDGANGGGRGPMGGA